jgi:hypothetical protein
MTIDELRKYLEPAMVTLYGYSSYINAGKLEELLATTEWSVGYVNCPHGQELPISDELRTQLEAIISAGPHAMTIVKIIRIRKGLEP